MLQQLVMKIISFECHRNLLLSLLSLIFWFADVCEGGKTSSYARNANLSRDMPLNSDVFRVPPGYNAPQQVHITQGDHVGKGVIVSWVTPDEPGSSTVLYWAENSEIKNSAQGIVLTYKYYNYTSGYIHHCTITDLEKYKKSHDKLQFDTKYYYEVGIGNTTRKFWLRTPPGVGPDVPYTFGLIGDLGQSQDSNRTIQHYELNPAKGQTVLFLGDLSYSDDYPFNDNNRWDTWGRFIERNAAYQPWIWTAGNHELDFAPQIGESEPFKPYRNRFHVPYKASCSTSPLWYSIKRASAHIVVLSSYSAFEVSCKVLQSVTNIALHTRKIQYDTRKEFWGLILLTNSKVIGAFDNQDIHLCMGFVGKSTPQYKWLRRELPNVNRTETPWLIVLMHCPLYTSYANHHMEGGPMRLVYEPWFVQYKVDVVFSGHVHAYERSERISKVENGKVTGQICTLEKDRFAPVHITIGDGGNLKGLVTDMIQPQPSYSAFREASFGHGLLDVKNRTHAFFSWHRNQDGYAVGADSVWLHNRYWNPSSEEASLASI